MSWDRVERLIGSDNLATLARRRVGVVGLGSGGGFVALSLAMSGVGRFVLIDDDTLAETNIVRHVADRRDLGRPKVDAVADLLRHRNPNAEVETHQARIEDRLEVLDEIDLLVVGVDGEGAKYKINEACLSRHLPAVYAGVYERGEGGDVTLIRPYDGPCYACWAAELRDGLTITQDEAGELDYGMIGPDGTLEAEPGLWLHVVRVAAVQAEMALNQLLRGTSAHKTPPGNTVILANDVIEIIDSQMSLPHTAVWVTIPRDPHCLVCGDLMRQRTALSGGADSDTDDELSLSDLMKTTGLVLDENDGENDND